MKSLLLITPIAFLLLSDRALASGLFVTDRGVGPMGKAGANVAGARDLHATHYNPAGLADTEDSFLLDASILHFSVDYTRVTRVTDAAGLSRTYTMPAVSGYSPFALIPTLGISKKLGAAKDWTIAFTLESAYAAALKYPENLDGRPAPQRYSHINLDGTALVVLGGFASYKVTEQVRVGAGIQALVGTYKSVVYASANPSDRVLGAPEDPQYDARSSFSAWPVVTPSGTLGATFLPTQEVRIGLSAQLPFWINAPATIKVRLPQSALFDRASQSGEDARIKFRLPLVLRAGVEYEAALGDDQTLRVEGSYVREFWSMHDTIDVTPDGISLNNVTGFPSPFRVGATRIERNFQDANIFRVGSEYTFRGPVDKLPMSIRAGVAYEQSAIPADYLSALSIDMDKVITAVGASVNVTNRLKLEAMYAHAFFLGQDVSAETAKIKKISPIAGFPTDAESINGGKYSAAANIVGVGAQYKY